MADQTPEIILLHETIGESLARNAGTFALIAAVIGTGWLLGSEAMQWLGFVMLVFAGMARAKGIPRLTPQQAADYLLRRHGVRAEGGH